MEEAIKILKKEIDILDTYICILVLEIEENRGMSSNVPLALEGMSVSIRRNSLISAIKVLEKVEIKKIIHKWYKDGKQKSRKKRSVKKSK